MEAESARANFAAGFKIGLRLAEAIKNSGLTQSEIARCLKVSQSNISHYLKGDKMNRAHLLAKRQVHSRRGVVQIRRLHARSRGVDGYARRRGIAESSGYYRVN